MKLCCPHYLLMVCLSLTSMVTHGEIVDSFYWGRERPQETERSDRPFNACVLGRHLDYLMNETLGVDKMQERINMLNFTRRAYDGKGLVAKLAKEISDKISLPVEGLKRTRSILEYQVNLGIHRRSTQGIYSSCCRYDESKIFYDRGFKTKIDPENLCQLVSDTTPLAYYSLPLEVLDVMKKNREEMPFLKWQYVGSSEGVFFSYPGHRSPELCTKSYYDPRYRPWYVEAATPAEKHVVIILDSSNSMAQTHNSRRLIDIATDAIETVLGTLTPKDKVGIVAFNDTAHFPDNCFSEELGFADRINKRKLTEGFLKSLRPGGQSNYRIAFREAFGLMKSSWAEEQKLNQFRPKIRRPFNCVMLFISDGDASEIHRGRENEIYQEIRSGNRDIRNLVTILTYGLGRNAKRPLLEKIAKQDFDEELGPPVDATPSERPLRNVTRGHFHEIAEPNQLRNQISFFYKHFIKNSSNYDQDSPSFSVPYVDQGGLGLIFTAGFPVIGNIRGRQFLAAVVAIDISLTDFLDDIFKMKNDDRSYFFVIDGTGRVLVHPLMVVPKNPTDTPTFIHIEAFERDPALKSVIESMMEGETGNLTLLSNRVAPAGDCNKVFIVNQTYHWHPIPNTNFSLCFVEEITDYEVHLAPQYAIQGCKNDQGQPLLINKCPMMSNADFHYHRLDLSDRKDVCRHFYQMSTVTSSVVKFAPQCFIDPISYEQMSETRETVTRYKEFFDEIEDAESIEKAEEILEKSGLADKLHLDVISDVIWTAYTDSLWFRRSETHVIRRYIGTRTGLIRFFPGTNISASFDPIKRDWYELALAHPGKRIFSPPYKDAAGAGNVITISHTLTTPKIDPVTPENERVAEEKIIGVMGLDLSLTSFYGKMLELYPNCTDRWHCILVDIRGYLVLHEDYIKTEAPERKHLTGEEGILSQILLKTGKMFRARCLEFESTTYKVSYVLQDDAFLDQMSDRFPKCERYYMERIDNTNIYFVAREIHTSCYYRECIVNNQNCAEHTKCISHENWSNKTCECPCRADLHIDSCQSYVEAQSDITACYPFHHGGTVIKTDCIPSSLPPCNDPQCSKEMDLYNCSSVVGCIWCQRSDTGSTLEKAYCSDIDLCYEGYEGRKLPGFGAEQETCKDVVDTGDRVFVAVVVSVTMLVFVLLTVVVGCFCLHRKMNARKKSMQPSGNLNSILKNDERVVSIAAAIGARADKYSESSSSSAASSQPSVLDEARSSSSSSHSSNNRSGRGPSSPQVVLSIVDSDGAEIARSAPRPVQIVRGGQGLATNPPGNPGSKSAAQRQGRGSSTTSIVLGSVDENSESSTHNTNEVRQENQFTDVKPNARARKPGSNGGSVEAVIRKRKISAPNRQVPGPSNGAIQQSPIDDNITGEPHRYTMTSIPEVSTSRQTKTLAATLLSVLRKKLRTEVNSATGNEMSTEETQSQSSTEPEIPTSSSGLYGVAQHQGRDIGRLGGIQEGKALEFRPASPATSDYVSVCSESGQISRRTTPTLNPTYPNSARHSEMLTAENYAVFFGENSLQLPDVETDLGDYFKVSSAYLMNSRNRSRRDATSGKDVYPKEPENDSSGIETNSNNPEQAAAALNDHRSSRKSRKNRKRDRSSSENRLRNLNTENFIVYV